MEHFARWNGVETVSEQRWQLGKSQICGVRMGKDDMTGACTFVNPRLSIYGEHIGNVNDLG